MSIIPISPTETLRYHRTAFQRITGDVLEALILDLFEQWTSSSSKFNPADPTAPIWISLSGDDLQSDLELHGGEVSSRTIRRRLNSLIEKNLLLSMQDITTRNPNARLFSLNIPEINRQISALDSSEGNAQVDSPTPAPEMESANDDDSILSLDEPLLMNPKILKATGDIRSGIFLWVLLQWQKNKSDADGWVTKTLTEWQDETTMTRNELQKAQINLKALNLIEEKRHGLPCKLSYRLNIEALKARIQNVQSKS